MVGQELFQALQQTKHDQTFPKVPSGLALSPGVNHHAMIMVPGRGSKKANGEK